MSQAQYARLNRMRLDQLAKANADDPILFDIWLLSKPLPLIDSILKLIGIQK